MTEWKSFFLPASDVQIKNFEDVAGVALPPRYRQFLLVQNGGRPRSHVAFVIPENNEKVILGALYGISDGGSSGVSLQAAYYDLKDELPHGYVAIGEDPGGNPLLLATTAGTPEQIILWDRAGILKRRFGKALFDVAIDIGQFLGALAVVS